MNPAPNGDVGDDLRRFLDASAAYIAWVDTYDPDRSELLDLHRVVADLQGALLGLPHATDDEDGDETAVHDVSSEAHVAAWKALIERLSSLPISQYRVVFDSLESDPDGLVTGWLADDLSDIYLDLKEGMGYWDAGDTNAAIWQWRFGYFSHWGRHATHAQSAILDYLRNNVEY